MILARAQNMEYCLKGNLNNEVNNLDIGSLTLTLLKISLKWFRVTNVYIM